ncbi:ubiquinol-cytochrome c reductase complex assembly factor 6 [Agelaius phoeniceus]|uniref:ubiquinol-cytochrome c reductase complex assembly factor 6 n=1 Tax=Agelaius phoeniceus TaxID=39638 RepID=UPI0040552A3C
MFPGKGGPSHLLPGSLPLPAAAGMTHVRRGPCTGPAPAAMPAGASWPTYLRALAASMLAMFAGAEVVHRYYRPDLSIPEIPPKPGELRTELLGLKERSSEVQTSQH